MVRQNNVYISIIKYIEFNICKQLWILLHNEIKNYDILTSCAIVFRQYIEMLEC